jgi:hypothetical protein
VRGTTVRPAAPAEEDVDRRLFRPAVRVSGWLLLGLFLGATAFAALDIRAGLGPHDEGLMLEWGRRIADGQWPYRDFWMNYLPGQPLLQALLGDSLVVWRVVRAATGALASVLAYLLVRREAGSERWALGAWAATATAMAWPLTPGPNASAVALALGALLAARRHPLGAGLLAGAAFLFRPEIGVAAAIGAAVAAHAHARATTGDPRRAAARPLIASAVVATAGLLPFLLVAPHDFLSQTFGFVDEQRMQRLPFPLAPHTTDPNKLLERLFPALLVATTALWAVVTLPRRSGLALLPLVAAGLLYLLARTDEFHLVPLAAVLPAGLATAGCRAGSRPAQAALVAGLAIIVLHGLDRQWGHVKDAGHMVSRTLATGPTVITTPADATALVALAEAVDKRTKPGDAMLSAPPRFDRVRVGDTLLYTLLDRTNPTRYDVVQPGVVTTAEVQREMVRDLRRARPRVIVRWLAPVARQPEDNASGRSSEVRILDRWIARNYRRAGRFGDYQLLQPRT